MGDWRNNRLGLTANERGIPKEYLSKIINEVNIEVIQKHYFYCMTSFLKKLLKKLDSDNWMYLYIDKCLSQLFTFNIHYHAISKIQRIAPGSVFYVLTKR
jgi:ABC-type uncharacterized transport system substrate-binding protein